MNINDLIFRELIKRGVKKTDRGRLWYLADSKLWYVTPAQAQGYLDLEQSPEYKGGLIQAEIELIGQNLDSILSQLPEQKYNLVDLGCGNGEKAAIFIKRLGKKLGIRYCPVDISSYMVSKALATVKGLNIDGVGECKENISDFENLTNVMPAFRRGGYEGSLILLLGNIIGNFDREDILEGIYQSMHPQDFLLIGTELRNNERIEEIVREYDSDLVNQFLIHLPRQVGLTDQDLEFEVEFNKDRVDLSYRVKRDKTIAHLGKTVEFKNGDRILAAISYKYIQDELRNLLEKRFETKLYSNQQGNYALALCRRKRDKNLMME
ncbi:L-histidine N(alpha)-methyltransferase [Candidatus Woesearchaeota archaeon]|nr:L-histidine N(alpha)-methyltransferase [Candidatus Woesearchaeota archaeon]